jgi:acyl-homoserine lactone acylase PvdQ
MVLTQRLIVAFEHNQVKAWSNYPGGQSGNPGSKYYDHFVKFWEQGQYIEILFLKDKEDKMTELNTQPAYRNPGNKCHF